MIDEKKVIDRFLRYVKVDSETGREGSFAKILMDDLKELGISVYVDDAGESAGSDTGNIIATMEGETDAPPVMFCCHMDTVSPGKNIQPVIKEDTIFSDGTTILGSDDKAGIASVLEALRVAKETSIAHGDIEVVFTVSEESGLKGSKNLDYSKIRSKHAFVLDSGGGPGAIVVKGPTQNKLIVKIIGKAAHAGVCPEEGISAIQVAASAINGMNLLRIDEDTTANIGVISGGTATNIVCPELEIKAEVRSLKDKKLEKQTASMIDQFRTAAKSFGAHVEIETEKSYDSFEIDEKHEIVEIVRNACNRLGMSTSMISTGGGSDTNILNRNGIKTVTLSKGGSHAHTVDEQIKIKDIVDTARLVLEIIRRV